MNHISSMFCSSDINVVDFPGKINNQGKMVITRCEHSSGSGVLGVNDVEVGVGGDLQRNRHVEIFCVSIIPRFRVKLRDRGNAEVWET
ncbi:MAG: hypothetical protein AB7T49_09000 [Oligoflexales bacterium]